MSYTIVNGTNGNNGLAFQGITQSYNETLVNPYSGYTITITGTKNVNNAIYDGMGGTDTLSMTTLGDVLTLVDGDGVIMVKNVEIFNAGDDGDIVNLAHSTVTYGNVTIRGSNGDDLLWSNVGNDTVFGGVGNDIMDGGGGNDLLFGNEDDDYLSGGLGIDGVYGGAGNDTLVYSIDGIWSGGYTLASLGSSVPYASLVNLDGKNQTFDTYDGDLEQDLTVHEYGTDTLILTSGADVLVISDTISPANTFSAPRIANIDIIEAGDGDDVVDLSAISHTDVTINGGNGDDFLASSDGTDTINGDSGNDTLFGGLGDDTLAGGADNDTYIYRLGDGTDTIVESSGTDTLRFGPGITMNSLTFETVGTDLKITVGGETITIENHFASDLSGRVETLQFDDNTTYDLGTYGPPEAPVANDDSFTGDEDTVITGNILDNDTDSNGDTLTVTPQTITTAAGGTLVLNGNGSFSYTAAANYNGPDSFSYTVSDGNGGTDTADVTLTIVPVNDQPVAVDDSFSGNEDEVITGSLLGNDSDVDGDTLFAVAETITTAQGGSVTINMDGTFSYVGAANFYGNDTFDYTLIDGNGGSDTASVTLTISSVNDDPAAVNDAFTGDEDTVITGNVLINDSDVDGDTLTITAQTITTTQGGTVVLNGDGSFSYTGAANFNGADSFDYTVTDGNGGSDTASVNLTVGAVNDDPVANDDAATGDEDTVIMGNVLDNDSDVDGDTLQVHAQTIVTAAGATVILNGDGSFSYTGTENFNGSDSFDYTVTDGNGGSDMATGYVTVNAINDAPEAADDSFNGLRNTPLNGNVLINDSDIDGDTLQVQAGTITTAEGGTVTINGDGSFTYVAADGFFGQDYFDYTVLDGQGGQDTANVLLNIALDPSQSIIGTDDGEIIIGTENDDEIFALSGNDTVKGMEGDDTLYGGEGDDILYGDTGVSATVTMDKAFSDTIIIPDLKERVNIANLKPPGTPALGIAEGNLHVDYDATASITFRQGHAGYNNSFGAFAIAEDGTIVNSTMYWANVKTAGVDVTHQIDLPTGADGGDFGFFIISNGDNTNSGYSGLDVTGEGNIHFIYNYGKADQRDAKITDPGSKISVVYDDGITVKVLKGDVYFTTERGDDASINKDGKVHALSGMLDVNNLNLNFKKADISGKPQSITKNGFTIEASEGYLVASGDKLGIKSSGAGSSNLVNGTESLHIGMEAAEKVTISLSNICGNGRAIDLLIHIDGVATPVSYEFATDGVANSKIDIVLNASDFGGLITGVDVSSVANSSYGTESFYLENVYADIPGGVDTNVIRIGFEDLKNTGDADYEDVLFDLDINPVTIETNEGGNDILDGGAGNDTLYGEGGDDILIMGLGADHAYGGAGADTFAVTTIDGLVDTIHDFNAAEGDTINIADVLDNYDPLNDDIANFVQLVQNGGNTELQINADGDVGCAFMTAAVILGGTGADTLATLIAAGTIVADHSAI